MTQIHITKTDAVKLLEQVVDERGYDYVYHKPQLSEENSNGSCVYTDAVENYSCMVGGVLIKAGVPFDVVKAIDFGASVVHFEDEEDMPETVEYVNGFETTRINDVEVRVWLRQNEVTFDDGTLTFLASAQFDQDHGMAYGEVIKSALSKAAYKKAGI